MAGENNCQTKHSSRAATSGDGHTDARLSVPAGPGEKLVGGKLTFVAGLILNFPSAGGRGAF